MRALLRAPAVRVAFLTRLVAHSSSTTSEVGHFGDFVVAQGRGSSFAEGGDAKDAGAAGGQSCLNDAGEGATGWVEVGRGRS